MNREDQNIEFKESWRDEYLAIIAGFANANGGKLVIGVTDRGELKGADKSKKLMEDLPNKIRDVLGLQPDVRLVQIEGKEIIEVLVLPSKFLPISYRAQYFQRKGSTNPELKGVNLTSFLLERIGQTFDGLPLGMASGERLSANAILQFRKLAAETGFDPKFLRLSDLELMDKLNLLADGGSITRAGVLAFSPEPNKAIPGAFVKIGYFNGGSIPKYQDELVGGVIDQVTEVIDLLKTKYLIAPIHFEGIQRIERYPIPDAALRECIINAIVHRDYSVTSPIQIAVGTGYLIVNNPGHLPEGWTVLDLKKSHRSRLRNPRLASVFKKIGYIEEWGSGISTIVEACQTEGDVNVDFTSTADGFEVRFSFAAVLTVEAFTTLEPKPTTKETDLTIQETAASVKETGQTTKETELTIQETESTIQEVADLVKETGQTTKETDLTIQEVADLVKETGQTTKETEPTIQETAASVKETGGFVKETGGFVKETGGVVKETGGVVKEIDPVVKETGVAAKETDTDVKETDKQDYGRKDKEIDLEKQLLILRLLTSNGALTTKSLAELVGLTVRQTRHHLDQLRAKSLLRREGSTKKPTWRVLIPEV